MSIMNSIAMFQKCRINQYTYDRMKYLNVDPFYQEKSYDDFIEWNDNCFKKLSVDDRNWVVKLCRRVKKSSIQLVDEESCIEFDAYWVFFNKNGKICLMNPR